MNFQNVKKAFEDMGYILLSKEEDYKNAHTKLKYICPKHGEREGCYHHISRGHTCKICAIERHSERQKGENNPYWNGGISKLSLYLRGSIDKWRFDSAKKYNFKCIITNNRFEIIHHLHNFNKIIQEVLKRIDLPLYDMINKYTETQLKQMEEICLELHYKYGFGVPLIKEIHILFHKLYGYVNNTPEQFEEFANDYYNNKFDDLLAPELGANFIYDERKDNNGL